VIFRDAEKARFKRADTEKGRLDLKEFISYAITLHADLDASMAQDWKEEAEQHIKEADARRPPPGRAGARRRRAYPVRHPNHADL